MPTMRIASWPGNNNIKGIVLRGSMQFGSRQEPASFFLDAGLPAVRFTRIASWPGSTKGRSRPCDDGR